MTDNKPIQIDLDAVQSQANLPYENLIQRHVYDALKRHIEKRLNWLDQQEIDKLSNLPAGMGWVSFIDGTRGAGKSTFLHNALSLMRKDRSINRKLAIMDWIDPSRIESNEIILLTLLRSVKELVDHHLSDQDRSEESRKKQTDWARVFKAVAGGLVLFQKDHHPLKELDEDLFFDMGLEQAGHSANLRCKLDLLFKKACEILGVKALLFSFDDADTNAHHAINLLETLRKYMDTPHVMLMVTGDLELYSLLVRQNFRHELAQGKRDEWGTSTVGSSQRVEQQIRMLDHLEEQYLLKLFPLRERHHLLPIWRLVDKAMGREAIAHILLSTQTLDGDQADDRQELIAFTEEKMRKGFRLATNTDAKLYSEFLLMQPIRTVLQVLARINTPGSDFHAAMLDLALHSLYQYNIAAEEIAANDFRTLCEAVFEVAMDDGDPDTSAYLRPTGANAHNRSAMFGLSAAVAQQLKGKAGTSIAYLFRGPGMVKLAHDAGDSNIRRLDDQVLRNEFKRYMGVGRNDDALGWARLATIALAGEHAISHTARVIRYGVIGINQEGKRTAKPAHESYSKAFKNLKDGKFPAAAFSLVKSSVNGTRTFASIYNILGLIGKLLQLAENPVWKEFDEKTKEQEIHRLLPGFFPNTNHVSAPPWVSKGNTDNDEPEPEAENPNATDEKPIVDYSEWSKDLGKWLDASQTLAPFIHPSSVLMGKIWARLFFGLENISDSLRPFPAVRDQSRGFASLMELFALCTVNAFLAEESMYHVVAMGTTEPKNDSVIIENPRSSAPLYLKRLSSVSEKLNQQRLPLTFIVATCPLITGLISFEKVKEHLSGQWPFKINGNDEYASDTFIQDEGAAKDGDWNALNSIAIQGKKNQSPDRQQSGKGKQEPNEDA